ncbi:hypothetical protein CR159_03425 [Pollutimonas subterranea]|uniref:Carrier domain-containing protein n=1 Tax=Pollutimonas subterranea TaxID=2045210 RepID=A0A2N4U8E0_9BURK|nr:AMP-binding protein [Pollutimonas subterranea]PLC51293.1 hypothetical protein CR159_03425 [Pollutimonas subterranea]
MKRIFAHHHEALKAALQEKGLLDKGSARSLRETLDASWPAPAAVQRLWLQECLEGDERLNGLGVWLRLEQAHAMPQVEQAIQALVDRHETLRTIYEPKDDQLYARVLTEKTFVPAPIMDEPDETALTQLLHTHSPSLSSNESWRVHPIVDADGDCRGIIWLMHHAVCDWFGLQVLIREFAGLLQNLPLADTPPMQPRHASQAERQRSATRTDTLRAYWRERLQGASIFFSPPIRLAAAASAVPTEFACERFRVSIDPGQTAVLRTASRKIKTTPYFFFLTAFVRLLQSLTLDEEVVVATTIAHRDRPGTETLAGSLSDLLPLRCDPATSLTFIQALRHIQTHASKDMAHAELGLHQIVEAVRPERRPGKAPLTQVMFNVLPPLSAQGMEIIPAPLPVARADLVFEILEDEGFTVNIECRADSFPAGFTQLLAQAWQREISAALIALQDPVSDTHTAAHCETVPDTQFAAAPPLLPADAAIELFMQQAKKTPLAPALMSGSRTISYDELTKHVDLLAHALREHTAFSSGCRVGVWLPRSIDLVVAVLACLKTGGIMMLLDPNHPAQRQRQILSSARPALLIVRPDAAPPIDPATAIVHTLDTSSPQAVPHTVFEPAFPLPDDAFIAFTSGSTGTPKGVVCTQRALVNRLAWYASAFPPAHDDVACLKTSSGFVDIYAEMLGPLCAGIPLVIASDETAADPPALASLMQQHRVTRLVLVPTLLEALLAHGDSAGLQYLRLCACSGEPLAPALARSFALAVPTCRLINIYGASEVTADATWAEIKPPLAAYCDIGEALPGVAIAVVDRNGDRVTDGFPGELAISGIALANHYLDDPVLTEKRFRSLPAFGGQRAFLSGDTAIKIPHGPLLLLGRSDRQLKLEGVRVDAAEIEAALASLAGISRCRVVMDTQTTPPRLLAAIVGRPPADDCTLRSRLCDLLPSSAIPQRLLWMDALPAGPTGKVDDAGILAAARQTALTPASTALAGHEAPKGDIELLLAQQWSELLDCTIDDRHAHFFEQGGSSLKAIMAMNRVRLALGLPADARWLFETPTLAGIAARIHQARADHPPAQTAQATPKEETVPTGHAPVQAPLTFNQQWLVREYTNNPKRTAYNLAIAYRYAGSPDANTLQEALQHLANRHAALRTRLKHSCGQWAQHIWPPGTPLLVTRRETPSMNDETAARHRDTLAGIPFVLNGEPLFRVEICVATADKLYLFMTAHHAMIDGWSSERLMRDLARHYAAICGQAEAPCDLLTGIGEIATAQHARLTTLAQALPAYRDYVTGGACPRCPSTGRGTTRGGPLASLPVLSQAPLHAKDSKGVTPFVLGLCALAGALQQFNTLDRPILIGFPEAGRHDPHLENSIAFLANTVLGRFDLSGQKPGPAAVNAAQRQLLEALSFRDIPAFWLQEQGWKGLDDRSDDLQAMVVPEQDFDWNVTIPGLDIACLGQATARGARVDLALTIRRGRQGGTDFGLEYDSQRVPHEFAQRLVRVLQTLLALNQPARPPTTAADLALAVVGDQSAQEAVSVAQESARPIPASRLDILLAGLAASCPDVRLAADATTTLTGAQLWTRAQDIARMMRRAHPAPGVVALCMERSANWLASLLAIWQTGSTAVIIDPQWPAERADFIIGDSGAQLLWANGIGADMGANTADSDAAAAPPNPVAALVYTSGSSGRPKGVPICHDALIRLGSSLASHYELKSSSTILQLVSPAFDVALSDIAMSWCSGASLVTLPQHSVMPGSTLSHAIDAWGITHLQAPAAVLNGTQAQAHPSLEMVAVGGEICPAVTLDAWSQNRKLFIVYGPTETTVTASLMPYRAAHAPGSLGTAVAGNRLAIVDSSGRPLLFGMPGELLIAGPQVAQGYHGHAQSLSKAFGTTSLFGEPCRAYLTGDRAWMDESGQVWLLGRLDRQFKIRGQRIDPEEIEIILRQHPAVSQAAIASRPTLDSGTAPGAAEAENLIVAWIVSATAARPSEETLRRWLQDRLPAAYVPARWVFIAELPLNANGKTDWAALVEPASAALPSVQASAVRLEDRDDLIEFLYACWCELLDRDEIEYDRSFFDYGGHSMLMVKLHERLEQATGLTLSIGEIFGHPTLDELANYLLEQINA